MKILLIVFCFMYFYPLFSQTDSLALMYNKSVVTKNEEERIAIRKEIAKESPESAIGYYSRGWLLVYASDSIPLTLKLEFALEMFENAIIMDSTLQEAYTEQVLLLVDMKKFDEALFKINRYLASWPNQSTGHLFRGFIYKQTKEYEKAIADLSYVNDIDSTNIAAHYFKAECNLKLNKVDQAISDLSKAIRINPNGIELYKYRGSYKQYNLDYLGAIADYTFVLQNDTTDYHSLYNRAFCYKKTVQYQKAITDFLLYTELNDSDVRPLYHLSEIYFQMNQSVMANKCLDKAIKDTFFTIEIYKMRGNTCMLTQRYAEALNSYQVLVKTEPTNAINWFNLGRVKNATNKYAEAIDAFNRSIALDSTLFQAYLLRGIAFYGNENYSNAIADITKGLTVDSHIDSRYIRAMAYKNLNNYEKALGDLNQCIALEPNHPVFYSQRYLINLSLGNYNQAYSDAITANSFGKTLIDKKELKGCKRRLTELSTN